MIKPFASYRYIRTVGKLSILRKENFIITRFHYYINPKHIVLEIRTISRIAYNISKKCKSFNSYTYRCNKGTLFKHRLFNRKLNISLKEMLVQLT